MIVRRPGEFNSWGGAKKINLLLESEGSRQNMALSPALINFNDV